ncbi:hypothetical protein H8D64_00225 [PVC group bacterium]|nr:hypothetical protein [PVC group bacterium]
MKTDFAVQVFGKADCDKCAVLNQRLDKLLEKDEWSGFAKVYMDVESIDGLIAFSEAECINPQRIPAMLISCRNEETGEFELMPNPTIGKNDALYKKSKLYQHLGLQTDYSDGGVISPKMIKTCLAEAKGCL